MVDETSEQKRLKDRVRVSRIASAQPEPSRGERPAKVRNRGYNHFQMVKCVMRIYFRARTSSRNRHATGLPSRNAGMNCHPAEASTKGSSVPLMTFAE
jgi:hypothetical protein